MAVAANHTRGVLLFGMCAFVFMGWLWMYPDDQSVKQDPIPQHYHSDSFDVNGWLEEHGILSLRQYLEITGACYTWHFVAQATFRDNWCVLYFTRWCIVTVLLYFVLSLMPASLLQ